MFLSFQKKLRKHNPFTAEDDTLFVVDPALATFAVSKERSFSQRGIGLFAFIQERQKYPDYPELRRAQFERFLETFSRAGTLRFRNNKWIGLTRKGRPQIPRAPGS